LTADVEAATPLVVEFEPAPAFTAGTPVLPEEVLLPLPEVEPGPEATGFAQQFGTGGPPADLGETALPTTLELPAEVPHAFVWPAMGEVTSILDWEHPLGIDIGVATGEPIAASADGMVVFAGGDPCCLYGLHVDIAHPEGYSTRYAHLSRVEVSFGQPVALGQRIGRAGNTGSSTGPHLHFELRRNAVVQDPLWFLP